MREKDTPRVALVTGASRGIGRAIAIELARDGHKVAVNYSQSAGGAAEVVKIIKEAGGEAFAVQADVSDREAVDRMFEEIKDRYGAVDILCNNAGILRDQLFIRMKDDDFQRVMDVNFYGAVYCCKKVSRDMVRNRWGRIINISSIIGQAGQPGQTNYAASKGALNGFTKALAKELASANRNITVNAILPGWVDTDATAQYADQLLQSGFADTMGRPGRPEEIASMVSYVASDAASFLNAELLHIDGGVGMG